MDPRKQVLYLYGGSSNEEWRNDLYMFDLQKDYWKRLNAQCKAGKDCPPPAVGSALLSPGVTGAITLAIGSPTEKWTDTAHEWRYIVPERSWVSEDLLRNEIQYQPEKEQ